MKMKILFVYTAFVLINHIASQWIDPHDMNTNAKAKYVRPKIKKSSSTSSINLEEKNIESDIYYSHLKRIVSIVANVAYVDKRDPANYYGYLRFDIKPDDYDFLVTFGKADLSLDKLRRLDTIFSESFKRSLINEYIDGIETLQLKFYSLVANRYNLWILASLCLFYFMCQLYRTDFSFNYLLKYLFITLLTCDFVIRYQTLLQEADEYNLSITYSSKCDPSKMSWSEWTKFLFSDKHCERRTVTPLDVFLYQVKNLIIIPMHALGTGFGGFGYNMFSNLPWVANIFMWPIMLVFVLLLVVIFTSQELNFFNLVKLKFRGTQNQNELTGKTVEQLMDKNMHRPMVQNINICLSPVATNTEEQGNENNLGLQNNSNNEKSSQKCTSSSVKSTIKKNDEATKCKDLKTISNEDKSYSSGSINVNIVKYAQGDNNLNSSKATETNVNVSADAKD